METAVAVISAVIALASAAVTVYYSYRALRLTAFQVRLQYFAELRQWAGEGSAALSAAIHLCDLDPKWCQDGEFFRKRHELRSQLSALIDRGRWFFPNVNYEAHGIQKEEAFRGSRHKVLSCLVTAYQLIGRVHSSEQARSTGLRDELVGHSRSFVSEIQKVLDPRAQAAEYAQITREGDKRDTPGGAT